MSLDCFYWTQNFIIIRIEYCPSEHSTYKFENFFGYKRWPLCTSEIGAKYLVGNKLSIHTGNHDLRILLINSNHMSDLKCQKKSKNSIFN